MRGISFVVIIQPDRIFTNLIDQNPVVIVDKSFLNKNCHDRESLRQGKTGIWLWHLPYGTMEEEIKDFLVKKLSEDELTSLEIVPLYRNKKATLIGYRLTLPERLHKDAVDKVNQSKSNQSFWPFGWRGRAIRGFNPGQTTKKDFQLCPKLVVVWFTNNQDQENISEFLKDNFINIVNIEVKQNNLRFPSFYIEVKPEDYKKILDRSMWLNMKNAKSVEITFERDRTGRQTKDKHPLFRIKVDIDDLLS